MKKMPTDQEPVVVVPRSVAIVAIVALVAMQGSSVDLEGIVAILLKLI